MRILFMGTPDYAVKILEALANEGSHEVVGIFTQPDKPVGRKQILQAPPVKLWAQKSLPNTPIFQPNNLKSQDTHQAIIDLKPEIIIVAAFGQLLPKSILNIAPCVNLHASILPQFRGASPIQHAILKFQNYTGVTAMLMDEGLDTGKMLGFSIVPIDDSCDGPKLFDILANHAADLSIKTLNLWAQISPIKQQNALSSYAPKITKKDGLVSLDWKKDKILAHFLALCPWPGIYIESGLKLLELLPSPLESNEPVGTIVKIENESAHIVCKDGVICIQKVQAPSKKPLNIKDYLQGQRRGVGDLLF